MGDYIHRFELQVQEPSQNQSGDTSVEWVTIYAGYARIAALGSSEFWQAAAVQAEDTVKIFTRYHPVFDERDESGKRKVDTRRARILCRGMELDIKSIENVGFRNEQVVIKAVARS